MPAGPRHGGAELLAHDRDVPNEERALGADVLQQPPRRPRRRHLLDEKPTVRGHLHTAACLKRSRGAYAEQSAVGGVPPALFDPPVQQLLLVKL